MSKQKEYIKKGVNKRTILFLCSLFSFFLSDAQDVADQLKNKFVNYQQKVLQEKVFVHTNKNYYVAGEILWFKLYNVDASFHTPIEISKLAYVEILDGNNKQVLHGKISLKNGSGNGSFYLPVTIGTGNYTLRAYTNWMKNFSPNFFFEKTIMVVNAQKTQEYAAISKEPVVAVRFFPEGGNLVYNIRSKVAFKTENAIGNSVECVGMIIDEANDTVVKFQSLKFGTGNFYFTPSANHTYHGVIKTVDGNVFSATLPDIFREGYVMSVERKEDGRLRVNVETNISSPGEVYLFAHTRQSVKVAANAVFQDGHASFLIDADKLGEGISHLTVFNNNKQPVCERLVFSFPTRTLNIEASTAQKAYDERNKIDVFVNATASNGQPQMADMSMSVYRLDPLQRADESSIASYLFLSSDLKGTVESPGYYFNGLQKETQEALDNLLLTQGWRRFDWNKILNDETPLFEFVPEYNGHIITAKIINPKTNSPVKNEMAYLSILSVRPQFSVSESDSNGMIKFELKEMPGSTEIIVQTNPKDDSTSRIDINNPYSEKYTDHILPPFHVAENYGSDVTDQSVAMQVQNIYSSEKLMRYNYSSPDTLAFYKKPPASYLLDKYTRFTTLEEVLREYVTSMNVRIRKKQFHLPVIDVRRNEFFENDPLLLLDGVPLFDVDKFMAFDPLKIKKADVVNERYFLSGYFVDGILSFYTYNGNLAGFEMDPHATVIDYDGLQLQREFYSPLYDTDQKKENSVPDFRNALYWSPDVKTDSAGKQKVSFYSSDIPGKYAVVLQGITSDGKCGSKTIMFEVKK